MYHMQRIMKGAYKKSLVPLDDNNLKVNDKIEEMVMKNQAIPELKLKMYMYELIQQINAAESEVKRLKQLNNNQINPRALSDFSRKCIELFNTIQFMIINKGVNSESEKQHYELMKKIKYDLVNPTFYQVQRMQEFLFYYLDKFGFSNLLISNNEMTDEQKIAMFEAEY